VVTLSATRRLRYGSARPARGSGVGSPGRRIGSRKGVGNSAPSETFRTGRRKARAESRFRWRTKGQPVRGTLSPLEPPPRAAVPVDAPSPVDIQVGVPARDPADGTAVETIRVRPAHLRFFIGVISDGERACAVGCRNWSPACKSPIFWGEHRILAPHSRLWSSQKLGPAPYRSKPRELRTEPHRVRPASGPRSAVYATMRPRAPLRALQTTRGPHRYGT
jgi:hypothetical protein